MAEFLGLVLSAVGVISLLWFTSTMVDKFNRANVKLVWWEWALLATPIIAVLLGLWRLVELRGGELLRYAIVADITILVTVLAMAPTKWDISLISGWREIKSGKESRAGQVVVVITVIASCYLMFEVGGLVTSLSNLAKESWAEVPKSTQFFYYGLGVAVLTAVMVGVIAAIFHEKPEEGVATTKIIVSLMCSFWGFLWMLAIFFSFLEKLGVNK